MVFTEGKRLWLSVSCIVLVVFISFFVTAVFFIVGNIDFFSVHHKFCTCEWFEIVRIGTGEIFFMGFWVRDVFWFFS
jgi:hypothetical protein